MFAFFAHLLGVGPPPPFIGRCGTGRQKPTDPPTPLPSRRRGRLSITADTELFASQRQSLFFSRLPGEVRALVYEVALASDFMLHIGWTWGLVVAIKCCEKNVEQPAFKHFCCTRMQLRNDGAWSIADLGPLSEQADFLRQRYGKEAIFQLPQLLLACRRMYSEAVPILYTHNTFELRQTRCLRFFSERILDKRFQAIRKLQFSEESHLSYSPRPEMIPTDPPTAWAEAIPLLTRTSGLQVLVIDLPSFGIEEQVLPILKLLRGIRHVRDFTVRIVRNLSPVARERLGEVPFELSTWSSP